MKDNSPLVSVAVICFNSESTVIETLESIKNQTYRNIEIIISDDGSTDNTVDICKSWIHVNKDRFVNTCIITTPKNTGVTFNYIRAEEKCNGEWIKNIDGDDILTPTAISDFVNCATNNPVVDIFYSKIKAFGIPEQDCVEFVKRYDFSFIDKTPDEQYEMIKRICVVPPMAAFYKQESIKRVGLQYDTRIPMMEDRPWILNAIKKGLKFGFLNKETLFYRIRSNSICNSSLSSIPFYKSLRLCYFYYEFPYKYDKNSEEAICDILKDEIDLYKKYRDALLELEQIKSSRVYRCLCFVRKILFGSFSFLKSNG